MNLKTLGIVALVGVAAQFVHVLPACAITLYTNTVDDVTWVYTLQNGCASLGGGSLDHRAVVRGMRPDMKVPAEIGKDKYPVTNISTYAFANMTNMTSITVPTNVITIQSAAFRGCTSLTNMVLPFVGLSRTPVGTTYDDGSSWRKELFGYIFGTTKVEGMAAIQQWDHTGYISGDNFYTTFYVPPRLEAVAITDEECLHKAAFFNLYMLKKLSLPACLAEVGMDTVAYCRNLTDLYVEDLEVWCRYGHLLYLNPCNLYLKGKLARDLIIPYSSTLPHLERGVFSGCTNLTSVIVPIQMEIPSYSFMHCSSLTNLVVPTEFAYQFGETAQTGMVAVTQKISSKSSGVRTAYLPPNLRSVSLLRPTAVDYGEFNNCSMIEEIFIGGSATNIQELAFSGCSGLKRLVFGGNAPTLSGTAVFNGVNSNCTVYVTRHSTGWGVDIPGKWNGLNIDYLDGHDLVIDDDLPHAVDGMYYVQQLSLVGDLVPWQWSMEYNDMATLTSQGELRFYEFERGIAESQTVNLKVTVTDRDGFVTTQTLSVTLDPYPNLRPDFSGYTPHWSWEDAGILRVGETQTFSVSAYDPEGQPLDYFWYLDDGSNRLDVVTNEFTWTPGPDDVGEHCLFMNCSDGERESWNYINWSFSVVSTNLLHVTKQLPHAIVGQSYVAAVGVTGGKEPYVFTAASSVASGLSLASDGTLSGAPTEAGRYAFSVSVQDADSVTTNDMVELIVLSNANYAVTTPEPVPYDYFTKEHPELLAAYGDDCEAAARAVAGNGVNAVWECYVAGISPTNETAQFTAKIVFDEDGNPKVKWSPDLNENGTKNVRTYRVLGAAQVGEGVSWVDTTDMTAEEKKSYRFFKVTVEMR